MLYIKNLSEEPKSYINILISKVKYKSTYKNTTTQNNTTSNTTQYNKLKSNLEITNKENETQEGKNIETESIYSTPYSFDNNREVSFKSSDSNGSFGSNGGIDNENILFKNKYYMIVKLKGIKYQLTKRYILLIDLVNDLFYNSLYTDILDANFLSMYSDSQDKYFYLIQRIMGNSIKEERLLEVYNEEYMSKGNGSKDFHTLDDSSSNFIWNVYINKRKYDFCELIEKNRIIEKDDVIEFRYEKYINIDI